VQHIGGTYAGILTWSDEVEVRKGGSIFSIFFWGNNKFRAYSSVVRKIEKKYANEIDEIVQKRSDEKEKEYERKEKEMKDMEAY